MDVFGVIGRQAVLVGDVPGGVGVAVEAPGAPLAGAAHVAVEQLVPGQHVSAQGHRAYSL